MWRRNLTEATGVSLDVSACGMEASSSDSFIAHARALRPDGSPPAACTRSWKDNTSKNAKYAINQKRQGFHKIDLIML